MIYTEFVPFDNSTIGNYKAWARVIGRAMTQFGWVKQTGHGELTDNGLAGTAYDWNFTPTVPTVQIRAAASYNFRGAWTSGTTYVGSNTLNGAAADLVTSGGITYVHITASSSLTTAPASDTTNWQPYNYEIWKSNGTNSGALPIYVRLAYVTSVGASIPGIHLSIGTSVDSNGNVTNAWAFSGNAPTTNKEISLSSSATGGSLWECDFSGDADNFRMFMWRNFTANSQPASTILVLDRAKNAKGEDLDAFVYGGHVSWSQNNSGATATSIIFIKPGLGTLVSNSQGMWCGITISGTAGANWGSPCVCPVTPLVGFVANPCLGVVTAPWNDVSDGLVVPVWILGASHNFLFNKNQDAITPSSNVRGIAGTQAVGILWE